MELVKVPYSSLKYTWHNGQHNKCTILEKPDWIFGNSCWFSIWLSTCSKFSPKDSSDHNVMVFHSVGPLPKLKAYFKLLNLWVDKDDFLGLVTDTWQALMDGNLMYRFTKRLGLLKPKLKALHHLHTSHISSCVIEAKTK